MAFQRTDRILSETSDDTIYPRLRTFVHRDYYIDDYLRQNRLVNHREEFNPITLKDERRRRVRDDINQAIIKRIINIERSRQSFKDLMSHNSDTSTEDEFVHSKSHRSRSARFYTDRRLPSSRCPRMISTRYNSSSRHNIFDQNSKRDCPATNIYQACHVMMIYEKDSISSSRTDEVIIKQKQNESDETIIVYKGYLKKGDTFSFKSQRLAQYPFVIKCYVNGHVNGHLSECCEYKYREGRFLFGESFMIQHVAKSIPCHRCKRYQQKEYEENRSLNSSNNSVTREDLKYTKNVLSDHRPLRNVDNIESVDENSSTEEEQEKENSIQLNGENNTRDGMSIIESPQSQQETPEQSNDSPKAESSSNFGSQFHQMLTERTSSSGGDGEGFFQSLLTLLQNGFRRSEPREPLPFRYQGNVEDFVVVLLGIKDESNLLQSIINFIKIVDDIDQLNSFIETLKLEKILLIASNSLAESLEDPSRFDSIYLLSKNVSWSNDHSNVRGVYPNLRSICEQIREECLIKNNLFRIESISDDQTTNQSFCYSQLLKETLLTQDNEANLKKDFLDFSRFHYNDNQLELALIDQFEQDFTMEKSIRWFTRNSFIRKMLNRALRTEEIDILYKMRWIIQSLDTQIKQTNLTSTVYRIHHLSSDELSQLKEHKLLSFGTFLDCTLNEPSLIEHIDKMEALLFKIETTVGMEIKEFRHSDSNIEVLLPLDTVYRIESIEKSSDKSYHWWNINLISVNKDNEELKEITNEMREESSSPVVLIQLAKVLLYNKDYSHVDYLARLLFNDNSLKDNPTLLASLAAVHHLLGSVDHRQNNHRAARLQFEQSLNIFLSFVSPDNQILSATYNNIGSMYYQEDEHDQAINYHQKALQCQIKSSSPDIEAIATYSGNIGAVYLDQKKYDQSLLHYKRSLQILQELTPGKESKSIAMVNDRIASVYWRMDKPNEALPFYERALQLELKYLPENDHKISVSYFNLSTAYAKLNRLDDAIEYAEKSVQQLLKSVPPDHPEVKENTEQLEGLRRKKWLQQLYQ